MNILLSNLGLHLVCVCVNKFVLTQVLAIISRGGDTWLEFKNFNYLDIIDLFSAYQIAPLWGGFPALYSKLYLFILGDSFKFAN